MTTEAVPVEVDEGAQADAHRAAQELLNDSEALIKVMITPTTCGVAKFDNGQRLLTMTQQGVEVSVPFGPGEAEQLSQQMHVSKVETASPAEAAAAGIVLP